MKQNVVLLAALVALALWLGTRGGDLDIYEGGEAREALVARAMLDTGDWVLPLWNGTVVPSKPPLFHWLIVLGARLTGGEVTPRALRMPSALTAALVVLLVCLAGVRWGGWDVGLLAGLVLVTTPQFLEEACDGRVDMTLVAAVTGAHVALVEALRAPDRRLPLYLLAICLGLAMLAKGPVGPGLVALSALGWAVSERSFRPVLRLVRPLPVLLCIAIAGSWYGLATLHRGADFIVKQIVSENGEALLGGARIPSRSPLFFVPRLVLGGLPWTLLLPWAVVRGWRGPLPRRYAVLWAATGFVFFSLAPLKRGAYLLPIRPAVALLVGWWLAEIVRAGAPAGRFVPALRGIALATAGVALGGVAAVTVLAVGWLPMSAVERLVPAGAEVDVAAVLDMLRATKAELIALSSAAALAAIVVMRTLGREQWRRATLATATVVICGALMAIDVVGPVRSAQKTVRPFALAVRERVGDAPLALLTANEEIPFLYYVGRVVPVAGDPGRRPPDQARGYYVLDQTRWERWSSRDGWEEVLRSDHLFSTHLRDLVLVRRR